MKRSFDCENIEDFKKKNSMIQFISHYEIRIIHRDYIISSDYLKILL